MRHHLLNLHTHKILQENNLEKERSLLKLSGFISQINATCDDGLQANIALF